MFNIMRMPISSSSINLAPEAATLVIGFLALIVTAIVVILIWKSRKKIEPFRHFDFNLTPAQRKKLRETEQQVYTKKCIDETLALLKKAIIKKTYRSVLLSQTTIYTIPLNREEAIMYIWGNVIASIHNSDRNRVIRIAALMLSLIKENKEKHILELEAKAIFAAKLYGNNAFELLKYRAVANVGSYASMTPGDYGMVSFAREKCIKTEFQWPEVVKESITSLRTWALRAISESDLINITVFPCISCHTECNILDLENLKCKNCTPNR